MAGLKLTMALSHYDRHLPLLDGSVQAEGVDLQVLEVGQSEPLKHGRDRHERMLQQREFDVCELSLSSYLWRRAEACRSRRFQFFRAGFSAFLRSG
jgi:4,5-dihydroxyphthalate decarboxylase